MTVAPDPLVVLPLAVRFNGRSHQRPQGWTFSAKSRDIEAGKVREGRRCQCSWNNRHGNLQAFCAWRTARQGGPATPIMNSRINVSMRRWVSHCASPSLQRRRARCAALAAPIPEGANPWLSASSGAPLTSRRSPSAATCSVGRSTGTSFLLLGVRRRRLQPDRHRGLVFALGARAYRWGIGTSLAAGSRSEDGTTTS